MNIDDPRKSYEVQNELDVLCELLKTHREMMKKYQDDPIIRIATSQLVDRKEDLLEELRLAEKKERGHENDNNDEITIVGRLFEINFGQQKFKVSSADGRTIVCNKNELGQDRINTLNNQAKYSISVRKFRKKDHGKETFGYIARSIEVLDPFAYSGVTDPKDASDRTLA